MHSKNHRQNHNFQILHFLVGACHTADAAYALLCDLREERQAASENYHVSQLRDEAKELKAKELLDGENPTDKLEARADLLELENGRKTGKVLFDAAIAEIAYIDDCIAKIQPLRKYAHLSDAEAHEACQQEEWKLELIERAENYLATVNHIPTDHFATMRMHPEFKRAILPRIMEMQKLLTSQEGITQFQFQIANKQKGLLNSEN